MQGNRPVPKIPVRLRYKGKEVPITALLDSGADYTFIPEDVAGILGIKYTRGADKIITGIDKELRCVECNLTLILEKDGERHEIPITAHVPKYSTKKVGVLIGRQGFFENFNVTFCEKTLDIYIEKAKKVTGCGGFP
jgi:hypothetical protein